MPAIAFEITVECPDCGADAVLGEAVLVREGVELVNQAFGMDRAQRVPADIELAGVVADDHRVGSELRAWTETVWQAGNLFQIIVKCDVRTI